jgi:hypothetical protein
MPVEKRILTSSCFNSEMDAMLTSSTIPNLAKIITVFSPIINLERKVNARSVLNENTIPVKKTTNVVENIEDADEVKLLSSLSNDSNKRMAQESADNNQIRK